MGPITVDKIPYGVPALGQVQTWADGREFLGCYWDASAPSTCAKGDFCHIQDDSDGVYTPQIEACATSSTVFRRGGVICATLTAAGYVWVQTKGPCEFAKVDGTTDVAVGDTLEAVNGAVHVVQDSATDLTLDSVAVAKEAETDTIAAQVTADGTAAATTIYILDRPAGIGM